MKNSTKTTISPASFPGLECLRLLVPAALSLAFAANVHAQTAITGDYSQNFDDIGGGLPTGWTIHTGATATTIGTSASLVTAATPWSSTSGQFANFASNNIASSSSAIVQAADTNRALGVRQTGSLGDPGASFDFNFSTINATVTSLSIDLMTLNSQPRETTWSIQYSTTPGIYVTLGNYVTGAFETTTLAYDTTHFGTDLNDKFSVYFRVVALTASIGAGSRDITAIDNFSLNATYIPPTEVTWTGTGEGAAWENGSAGHFAAPYSNSLTNSVIFAGASETVTTSGLVQAGGISFNASNSGVYTLTGDGFTLGAVGITTTTDAIISAPIAGSVGLTKNDAGILTLTSDNTFTGNVTISGGALVFSQDSNLGDIDNDIVLNGGTLRPTASVILDAGRNLNGSGTIDIPDGELLTVSGETNLSALTLVNTGALHLAGPASSVGNLTVNLATTISALGGPLAITGSVTTSHTAGTVEINGLGLSLGTAGRLFNVADGSASTDLLIAADIVSSGSGRLQKRGAGTVELAGDNSLFVGVQLGAQGTTPAEGGRILLSSETALGTGQTQANYGTLEAGVAIVGNGSVSIGGRASGFPTFTGSPITFTGTGTASNTANSFFLATGTSAGAMRFNVDNTTTLAGAFAATSGSGGSATVILVGGSGKLVINGDATPIAEKWATQDTLNFNIGSLGKLGAGGLEIGSTSTLILDIVSLTEFASGDGILTMDNGGKLVFDISTTERGSWTLFLSGAGTYTDISVIGAAYGDLTLTDSGGGIWTVIAGDGTTLSYDTATTTLEAVPEPATVALVAMGLALALYKARRRFAATGI